MRGVRRLAEDVWQVVVQPGINAWVLRDADEVTLIDAGLDAPGLRRALGRLGIDPADVTRVLLTHGHGDHAGGLTRLRRAGGERFTVAVGAEDLATVRGHAPQPDVDPRTRLGRLINRLPPVPKLGSSPPWPDATPLSDGDELPLVGGLRVVATPGHTPGHLAFHLTRRDVVIGGDAMFNVFRLRPAPAFLCADVPMSRAAVAILAGLAPSTLALAHGSAVTGDVAGRLQELTAR